MRGKEEIKKTIEEGKAVLGIEFGSTRIKAVLIDEDKSPIASGSYDWENQFVDNIWTYSMEKIQNGLQGCYQDLVKDVEAKYNVHVFYGIFASEISSDELVFLTVSNNQDEWAEELHNLKFHKPKAYIYNFTNKQIVEKQIKYIAKNCCLIRRQ